MSGTTRSTTPDNSPNFSTRTFPAAVTTLRALSSMATRHILADLCASYQSHRGVQVVVESLGGVEAAARIAAGERCDLALLSSDAIDRLARGGSVVANSRVDWAKSPVAAAVQAGRSWPDISSERALQNTILAARSLSYSTGPSGVYLEQLFTRWGIMETLRPRIVVPRPGVPCGALVAAAEVEIGFQQLAELIPVAGIEIVGILPSPCGFTTTFSSGICSAIAEDARRAQLAKDFQAFLTGAAAETCKRRRGMSWLEGPV